MPSQLQQIQEELRRRLAQPRQPMDEVMPNGVPAMDSAGQQPMVARPVAPATSSAVPPAPIGDPDRPPAPGTPQYDQAMGSAMPVSSDGRSPFSPPGATRQRAVSFNPKTGEPTREFYDSNPDRGAGAAGYRDALQTWKPHGGRGLWGTLKEAALAGAEAVNRNPNHPVEALIGGGGAGLAGSLVRPGNITRGVKLNQANQNVERVMGEDRARAQTEGIRSQQDAREAQILAAQERLKQGQQKLDIQGSTAQARIENWKSMRAEQRKARIAREYSAGMLNDPDSLEYAADELGIPGQLRDKFIAGQLKNLVNDKGEIVTQNQATGEIKPTGVTSYVTTQEAGRNRRFNEGQNRTDARTSNRTSNPSAKPVRAPKEATDLVKKYNEAKRNESASVDPAQKASWKAQREAIWDQVMGSFPGLFETTQADGNGYLRPKVGGSRFEPAEAPDNPVNKELMPDKGHFDRDKYVKTYQRMHGGKLPSQAMIEDAETRWTNP